MEQSVDEVCISVSGLSNNQTSSETVPGFRPQQKAESHYSVDLGASNGGRLSMRAAELNPVSREGSRVGTHAFILNRTAESVGSHSTMNFIKIKGVTRPNSTQLIANMQQEATRKISE